MSIHNYPKSWPWEYDSMNDSAPIKVYRILNLKEGSYLDNMTFLYPSAAQSYLYTYLAKQWETYEKIMTDYRRQIEFFAPINHHRDMIGYYRGEPFSPPTDREYMFEIVEQ